MKRAQTSHLLCKRKWQSTSKTHVREMISKLSPIQASVIYHIPHSVGSARISDWLENSLIMVVYGKFFLFQSELSVQSMNKKFPIDNHYKTIFKSVRNACTSYRVFHEFAENTEFNECFAPFRKKIQFLILYALLKLILSWCKKKQESIPKGCVQAMPLQG